MIHQHLTDGHDVVLGQYLARTVFLEELEALALQCGARFVETDLILDAPTLEQRLRNRRRSPDRPEQVHNDRHVGPEDAAGLVASIDQVLAERPGPAQSAGAGDLLRGFFVHGPGVHGRAQRRSRVGRDQCIAKDVGAISGSS